MADSGQRKSFSLAAAAFFFPIILYCIPLSIFLLGGGPSADLSDAKKPSFDETAAIVANIKDALLSRGNYSAMIPDLEFKLLQHYYYYAPPAAGAITVFVPSDAAKYNWCEVGRPEVQIVTARVDRESFGPGGLSDGSTLPTRDGGAFRVTKLAKRMRDPKAEVTDWSLYDDGHVVVHGMGGVFYPNESMAAAVERFAISGLIVHQKRAQPYSFPPYEISMKAYIRECVRRVDDSQVAA